VWSNFSPSGKIAYTINEDTLAYVGIATGFKSGGYNTRASNNLTNNTYNPEKVKTYSAGLKTTLFDGQLRLNTEAFYNDYTDKQLSYLSRANGAVALISTNAGKVTTKGVESEISWLTPIDGLQFDLSVGYLEANIDEFIKDNVDVSSHTELGFSPRWTVQPRLSYSMSVGDYGDLIFAADASYRTSSYTNSPVNTNDPNDSTQVRPESTIYDANIVFNTVDKHWRFALEGKNLSNRRVLTSTYNLDFGFNPAATSTFVVGSYNDPRTWGFSAAYIY
jgi:iron complex outermembrane receptor protein